MMAKLHCWTLMMCFCVVLGQGLSVEAWATTMYSYVDDQGNLVYTDALETIPQKYRAKVKTHEQRDAVTKPPSALQSVQEKVKTQAKNLGWGMSSVNLGLAGLAPEQSRIVTQAGIAAVVLLAIILFSKNSPMVRLLALGLLILLGIGTPVLMYTSDGGPMDRMKEKAVAAGQTQQNRLQTSP
ncbi:MAG: DUF4124 domain-containing protein [Nitrospira sp.]